MSPKQARSTRPELDTLDRKILRRYQRDTRVAAQRIAAAVGLSTAAVQRRLRRMRDIGVIEAETARLDPLALGFAVTCVVGVELIRETASGIERFKQRMARYPQVQQCYYVTGSMDFMLVVLAADMRAYELFTHKALLDDGNVRSFVTYVVLDRTKTGSEVPVEIE